MRNIFTLSVKGTPKGQPRPRAFARKMGDKFVARVYDAGTAENWKQCVVMEWKECGSITLNGPIACRMIFRMPRAKSHFRTNGDLKESAPEHFTGKPDCDNLAKAVLDCLTQAGAWKDDSHVVEIIVTKRYCDDGYESVGATICAHEI